MTSAKTSAPRGPIVHIVEDDASTREATARLLRSAGHEVATYGSAQEFLASAPADNGCLILDLQLPGLNGLDLQNVLKERGEPLPSSFSPDEAASPIRFRQ